MLVVTEGCPRAGEEVGLWVERVELGSSGQSKRGRLQVVARERLLPGRPHRAGAGPKGGSFLFMEMCELWMDSSAWRGTQRVSSIGSRLDSGICRAPPVQRCRLGAMFPGSSKNHG